MRQKSVTSRRLRSRGRGGYGARAPRSRPASERALEAAPAFREVDVVARQLLTMVPNGCRAAGVPPSCAARPPRGFRAPCASRVRQVDGVR